MDKLTKEEWETIITYYEPDGEYHAYTTIPRDMNKFQKQEWTEVSRRLYDDGSIMSMSFTAPKNADTIRNPKQNKREYTDAQRQAMAERLRNVRKKIQDTTQ